MLSGSKSFVFEEWTLLIKCSECRLHSIDDYERLNGHSFAKVKALTFENIKPLLSLYLPFGNFSSPRYTFA